MRFLLCVSVLVSLATLPLSADKPSKPAKPDGYVMKEGLSPSFEYQGSDGTNWIATLKEADLNWGIWHSTNSPHWLIYTYDNPSKKYEWPWIYFKDGNDGSPIQMKVDSHYTPSGPGSVDTTGGHEAILFDFSFRRRDGDPEWTGNDVIIRDRTGQKWDVAVDLIESWPKSPNFILKKVK
jgi:hypothetical protein